MFFMQSLCCLWQFANNSMGHHVETVTVLFMQNVGT